MALVGTLSKDGVHLHIAISDYQGHTIGGHLLEGCQVRTTAEVVIGVLKGVSFTKKFDAKTGCKELFIKEC